MWLDDGPAHFDRIKTKKGGEGANQWYRVTIAEGRNREVRRMFEAVGRAVSRLIRVRYGVVLLPRGLRRGQWMELGERDLAALLAAAGMDAPTGADATVAHPGNRGKRRFDRGAKTGPRASRPASGPVSRPASERLARDDRQGSATGYISPTRQPGGRGKGNFKGGFKNGAGQRRGRR